MSGEDLTIEAVRHPVASPPGEAPGRSVPRAPGTAAPRGSAADSGPGRTARSAAGTRRPDRWKVLFVSLLVVGVLGAAAWVLLGSRLLVVRQVDVAGSALVPRDRVLSVAAVRIGTPMARLDTDAVRRKVAALRGVESARVERRWPTSVRIVVKERVPVVSVERSGRFYELDRFGETVLDTTVRPSGLPVLLTGSPGPADPATRAALTVRQGLPARYATRLAVIEAASPESVTLRMKTGKAVVWGSAEHMEEKLRLLDTLLGTPAGRTARTIDVSSPEVVTTE